MTNIIFTINITNNGGQQTAQGSYTSGSEIVIYWHGIKEIKCEPDGTWSLICTDDEKSEYGFESENEARNHYLESELGWVVVYHGVGDTGLYSDLESDAHRTLDDAISTAESLIEADRETGKIDEQTYKRTIASLAQLNTVTAAEAAELIGVAPSTVSRAAERGDIAGRKGGHIWLLNRASVMAYNSPDTSRYVVSVRPIGTSQWDAPIGSYPTEQEAESAADAHDDAHDGEYEYRIVCHAARHNRDGGLMTDESKERVASADEHKPDRTKEDKRDAFAERTWALLLADATTALDTASDGREALDVIIHFLRALPTDGNHELVPIEVTRQFLRKLDELKAHDQWAGMKGSLPRQQRTLLAPSAASGPRDRLWRCTKIQTQAHVKELIDKSGLHSADLRSKLSTVEGAYEVARSVYADRIYKLEEHAFAPDVIEAIDLMSATGAGEFFEWLLGRLNVDIHCALWAAEHLQDITTADNYHTVLAQLLKHDDSRVWKQARETLLNMWYLCRPKDRDDYWPFWSVKAAAGGLKTRAAWTLGLPDTTEMEVS